MTLAVLSVLLACAGLSVPLVWLARRAGRRLSALDGAGVPGQVKVAVRRVPNTGGIGLVMAMLIVVGGLLLAVALGHGAALAELAERAMEVFGGATPGLGGLASAMAEQLPRLERQAGAGLVLLGCVLGLHLMGVYDDRRPLGPWPKMVVMVGAALIAVLGVDPGGSRVLTALDAPAGGAWLSVALTVLWIVAVTNAMNFIDNMDGLCAGVTVICGLALLALALLGAQWLVAALLAALVGACAGFLVFNFPWRGPASVFMGDGGSLVCGFILAVASVRLTYVVPGAGVSGGVSGGVSAGVSGSVGEVGAHWHAVLVPLVVLSVPLYDLVSVTYLRVRKGKSPLVGDLQHLSHRLHLRGLSKRAAVVVICGLSAITALGGVLLPQVQPWQGGLIFGQTALALVVLAVWEWKARAKA